MNARLEFKFEDNHSFRLEGEPEVDVQQEIIYQNIWETPLTKELSVVEINDKLTVIRFDYK